MFSRLVSSWGEWRKRPKPNWKEELVSDHFLLILPQLLIKANELTSETDTISGTATTTNYGYDSSNQLTSAGSTSYAFDANGNQTTGITIGPNNRGCVSARGSTFEVVSMQSISPRHNHLSRI